MADKKTLSPEEKKLAAEKHVDELVQKALVALEEMRKLDQEQTTPTGSGASRLHCGESICSCS